MSDPRWGEVPALALTNIFKYLNFNEKLRASSVCWHWRSILFQKSFFQNFKFNLHIENDQECNFFAQHLISLTSEVTIIFDYQNAYHIEKIRRILLIIAKSDYLKGIRFHTNSVDIVTDDRYSDNNNVEIQRAIVEPIKMILSRKRPSIQILDLGAIEGLTSFSKEFMKAFARPQDLQEITLASIKYDPCHYRILTVDIGFFEKCTSLQVLSIDYDVLNENMLITLQILPLKTLMLCLHGDNVYNDISDVAWAAFSSKFKNIKLILTLIYAFTAVEDLQHTILRRSMPLTHLRVLFCNYINIDALEMMSVYYKDTLRSVQWIDSAYHHRERNVLELYVRSGQDPFVMMSWLCKNLEEIVLHGYVMDLHNLVGISRLRGRNLKRLEVSMLDPPTSRMVEIVEEISTQLGQKWSPVEVEDMHSALDYTSGTDEIRDEYILDIIRSDLKN